jgi:WD40 repeat protein
MIVWDLTHRPTPAHAGPANTVVFRAGGRQLATGGDDGAVRLWDVARRTSIGTLTGHTGSVRAAAFNTPGTLLATGGDDNTVRTWNVETGKQIGPALDGPPPGTRAVTFSPDASMLAAANDGPMLRVWQSNRPTPLDLAVGDDLNGQYRVSFSPDNSKLIATSRDVTFVFDPQSGSRIGQPQPVHSPPSAAPAVAAGDGSVKVTIDDDQFVRLWDAQNRLQATLYGHRDTVLDAALSDDRHTLATVSRDGALMIWDTNPDRVAIEICEALGELTPDQWRNYITDLPWQTVCSGR